MVLSGTSLDARPVEEKDVAEGADQQPPGLRGQPQLVDRRVQVSELLPSTPIIQTIGTMEIKPPLV